MTAFARAVDRSRMQLARHGVTIAGNDEVFDAEYDDPDTVEMRRRIVVHLLKRKHIRRMKNPIGWIADKLGLDDADVEKLAAVSPEAG